MWTVILFNSAGELDRREVRGASSPDDGYLHPRDLAAACADWLLGDGDTIKIVAPTE